MSYLTAGTRLRLDVTDHTSADAAIAAAGRIDILVSNAGQTLARAGGVGAAAPGGTTVPAPHPRRPRVTQAVLPPMRSRGSGQIVYVSSMAGRIVAPPLSAYTTSKWAPEAIAETLAIEAKPFGIKVSILQPVYGHDVAAMPITGSERTPRMLYHDSAAEYALVTVECMGSWGGVQIYRFCPSSVLAADLRTLTRRLPHPGPWYALRCTVAAGITIARPTF